MRVARTSTIFAFVCELSVTMPACDPVSETASWPRSWITIAQSAFEIRSPVETSMSYSRGLGLGETSKASRISSSVVWPIAESTATTFAPAWRKSPWVGALAAATGTLLVTDAWFDIVLESHADELWNAVYLAIFAELPVAILCFWIAYRTERFLSLVLHLAATTESPAQRDL